MSGWKIVMMLCVTLLHNLCFCAALVAFSFLRLPEFSRLASSPFFCATILDISCGAEREVQCDLLWLGGSKPFWNLTTRPPTFRLFIPPCHLHFL